MTLLMLAEKNLPVPVYAFQGFLLVTGENLIVNSRVFGPLIVCGINFLAREVWWW